MDGAAKGLANTGVVTILVGDVNDNPPTFTKPSVSDEQTSLLRLLKVSWR